MQSLTSMERIGTENAILLFEKQAPPNNAIAPIGVKLKGWGSSLLKAARKMAVVINTKRGVRSFELIFSYFWKCKISV